MDAAKNMCYSIRLYVYEEWNTSYVKITKKNSLNIENEEKEIWTAESIPVLRQWRMIMINIRVVGVLLQENMEQRVTVWPV